MVFIHLLFKVLKFKILALSVHAFVTIAVVGTS